MGFNIRETIYDVVSDLVVPVKDAVLDSFFGEAEYIAEDPLAQEIEVPPEFSTEFAYFVRDWQSTKMSDGEVLTRLLKLDRLRTAQTLQERRQIVDELRRACA